jgi:hypothetical protein
MGPHLRRGVTSLELPLVLWCFAATLSTLVLTRCVGRNIPPRPQDEPDLSAPCDPGVQNCRGQELTVCNTQGTWQVATTCDGLCTPRGCTVCSPGQTKCDDGRLLGLCSKGGTWDVSLSCFVCGPIGPSDFACIGECSPGSKLCSANSLQTCTASGDWQDEVNCAALCSNGVCVGVCRPGERKCESGMSSVCSDMGQWDPGVPCTTVCSEKGCLGTCAPGMMRCRATGNAGIRNTQQTCNAQGEWQDTATCAFVCSDNTCNGSCVPGQRTCRSAQPQICSPLGAWVDDGSACPNVCDHGTCAATCQPNTKQCAGNIPETCTAGNWVDGTACASLRPHQRHLRRLVHAEHDTVRGQRFANLRRDRTVHEQPVSAHL